MLNVQNLKDTIFVRETSRDFKERLEQDESDGVWSHWVLFDTRHQISCDE